MHAWKDYKLHLCILFASVIAELIGFIRIPVGKNLNITFLPLMYAMAIMLILYLIKSFKLLGESRVKAASITMSLSVCLLVAKLGIICGAAFEAVLDAGVVLVLQNLGNIGTIFFALPLALLLGIKRESIGLTHALSREPNVALVSEKYGAGSAEFRGVMMIYVVGTILGPLFMGIIPTFFVSIGLFSPESAAMGVGAGSAAMMTAGIAALADQMPDKADIITAYANISNLISSMITVYLAIFLGLPVCEFMYKHLEPVLGGWAKKTEGKKK